jgi:hypothetical protein
MRFDPVGHFALEHERGVGDAGAGLVRIQKAEEML